MIVVNKQRGPEGSGQTVLPAYFFPAIFRIKSPLNITIAASNNLIHEWNSCVSDGAKSFHKQQQFVEDKSCDKYQDPANCTCVARCKTIQKERSLEAHAAGIYVIFKLTTIIATIDCCQ